jgi:hypothetical protein
MDQITISSLLRKAITTFRKEKKPNVRDEAVIKRFIAFFLKEHAKNIYMMDRRASRWYFKGFIHCFLLFVLIVTVRAFIKLIL